MNFIKHAEKENLCLYGLPNETWEVNLPVEEVPPELPEPALGINFARDEMQEKEWLSLVAGYFLKKLFQMINDLPTVFEVLTGNVKKSKDHSGTHHSSSKNKSAGKVAINIPLFHQNHSKAPKMPVPPNQEENGKDEEEEDEQAGTLCGACGENYTTDEFWILCDVCEKWFHGKCVKVMPAKAEHIKRYKCPGCNNKRSRV
ncbi:hypothetical protein RND81_13G152100 [Saponaria officinalis]|uniref:PHD finger protein ALFIN-LIKE n=1 Tax=Saponaria officinalis TaxID=3572 RepID=A0AAW1GY57_SAPOF